MLQGALPSPSGKGKKQAHAERMRAVALSQMLSTRLRYAVFKVENGWTRQSLSEVENLFYRRQVSLSKPGLNMKASPSVADKALRRYSPASPSPARKDDVPNQLHQDTSSYAEFWSRIDTSKNHMTPALGAEPGEAGKEPAAHAKPNTTTYAEPKAPASIAELRNAEVHIESSPNGTAAVVHSAKHPAHSAKHAAEWHATVSDDSDAPHSKRTRT